MQSLEAQMVCDGAGLLHCKVPIFLSLACCIITQAFHSLSIMLQEPFCELHNNRHTMPISTMQSYSKSSCIRFLSNPLPTSSSATKCITFGTRTFLSLLAPPLNRDVMPSRLFKQNEHYHSFILQQQHAQGVIRFRATVPERVRKTRNVRLPH